MSETNKHPADELADIRFRIRELKLREDELRGVLIGLPESEREGHSHVARVIAMSQRTLDPQKLEEVFGDLEPFYNTTTYTMVSTLKLKPRFPPPSRNGKYIYSLKKGI